MDIFDRMLSELSDTRSEYLESWAGGVFTEESVDGTAQRNAEALGKVQMLDSVIEMVKAARVEYDNDEE